MNKNEMHLLKEILEIQLISQPNNGQLKKRIDLLENGYLFDYLSVSRIKDIFPNTEAEKHELHYLISAWESIINNLIQNHKFKPSISKPFNLTLDYTYDRDYIDYIELVILKHSNTLNLSIDNSNGFVTIKDYISLSHTIKNNHINTNTLPLSSIDNLLKSHGIWS